MEGLGGTLEWVPVATGASVAPSARNLDVDGRRQGDVGLAVHLVEQLGPMAALAQSLNGCEPSGFRPAKCQVVKAPEIDVGSGLAALAVLLAGLALAYERRRGA